MFLLPDRQVSLDGGGDAVTAYFGLRTFELGDGPKGKRPLLNGKFTFLAGNQWYSVVISSNQC